MKECINVRPIKLVIPGLIGLSVLVNPVVSVSAPINDAIVGGKAKVDVRLRTELVDQEGMDDSANATTLRTRIGYQSGSYKGVGGFFEFENTTALIDDYSTQSFKTGQYPVVADPEGTEVNQAYLSYSQKDLVSAKLGRQRIIFDGARFVGNVGWRQNEQTYDGALISIGAIPKSSLKYAYLTKINNIFGKQVDFKTHLLNYSFKGIKNVKIGAYAYMLDFDTGSDSKTLGVNVDGKLSAGEKMKVLYHVELAQMSDYADADSGDTANYYNIEAGLKAWGLVTKLGYEVLGGDGTTSFQTPLATKHKFNGWADKFLSTPADGLTDTYITVVKKVMGAKVVATYHNYSSDHGSKSYGSEIDLLIAKKFAKIYSGGVKYANYMADDHSVDTSKIWLWAGISF